MGAAAPARKPAPRRAPTRKATTRRAPARKGGAGRASNAVAPAPQRQRRPQRQIAERRVRGMPGTANAAAARTAHVLRGLPDSGLIVRLTRGRRWIALLSVLLTGIVALNVVSLSLNASQGKIAQESLILEQENSALRARLAVRLSNDRVRNAAAASLGMTSPGPSAINYVQANHNSTRLTGQRLSAWMGGGSSFAYTPTTTSSSSSTLAATPTTTSVSPTG